MSDHYFHLPCSVHDVETGKNHPFVQAVIQVVKVLEHDARKKTVGYGWNGGSEWQMRNHAARAVALAEVLRILENSIGKDEDGKEE